MLYEKFKPTEIKKNKLKIERKKDKNKEKEKKTKRLIDSTGFYEEGEEDEEEKVRKPVEPDKVRISDIESIIYFREGDSLMNSKNLLYRFFEMKTPLIQNELDQFSFFNLSLG